LSILIGKFYVFVAHHKKNTRDNYELHVCTNREVVLRRVDIQRHSTSELRGVTCHYGITCHPKQVNTPRLNPSHTGQYSIYLSWRDERPSCPELWWI